MITFGKLNIAWGCQPEYLTMPIELPEGVLKVRRRMRPRCELKLFLKFKDHIQQWVPEIVDGKLRLWAFRGANSIE
jgi:hypothetical protein